MKSHGIGKGPPDWRNQQLVDAIRQMMGKSPLYERERGAFANWMPTLLRREQARRRRCE